MLDNKSEKYLNELKDELGYIGGNSGYLDMEAILKKKGVLESAKLEILETLEGFLNSSEFTVYQYENDGDVRYCAEFGYQTDMDDYTIETLIFNKQPSLENIHTIISINDLEFMFKFKRLLPKFKCWECGRVVHWVDLDGDFEEKRDKLEDKYCGC